MWFYEQASHRFLTYLLKRIGIEMTITSAKQLPDEALNKIGRWLCGYHPDPTVDDEVNVLDAQQEKRRALVINLIGAVCPKEKPNEQNQD